jgi:translation initiation factor eIF-2B subunit gamma
VIAQWEKFFDAKQEPLISSKSTIKSTQIVQCSVGDKAEIAEKTSLKNSCIGANCIIHPKSRIIDSLLMNNVVVEEGCVIENSIICDNVKLGAGSFVKKCLVGPMVVVKGTREEDVHLTESDDFMEIE